MRKPILRTMAVGMVAFGALAGSGATVAHAASGVSFTDSSNDALDPILTQNRLVAVPSSTPRGYADITNVVVTPNGSSDVAIDITTASATPTFPTTNGDTGIQLNACFDIPNGRAIANGPVQVGTGHHGAPIFDGPYNSRYGWKVCAWASEQAGGLSNITDWGVAVYDPIGQYTFYDQAQLVGATAATGFGSSVHHLHFPYTWVTSDPPPPDPEIGIARTESRQFLAAGDTAGNVAVSSQVTAEVTLPTTVCVPADCSLVGPIQGVGGLLATVDWAPGRQICSTPVASCTNDDGGSGKGNGFDLGLVPVGFPGGAVEDCDAANLNSSCPVVEGTVNYDPCANGSGSTNSTQDAGDLYAALAAANQGSLCTAHGPVPWPFEYHAVNGRTLTPDTPQYTSDTASFVA